MFEEKKWENNIYIIRQWAWAFYKLTKATEINLYAKDGLCFTQMN